VRRGGTGAPSQSVAFLCEGCGREVVQAVAPGAGPAPCPDCGRASPGFARDWDATRPLARCLHCGLDRLYLQKDFNKKAGLWVFIVAALLSVPTWGLSLLAATLIDLALYYALGDATLCYGCGAVHRGFRKNVAHGAFDIHVQEAVDRRARTA
jgi:hypothetical protein